MPVAVNEASALRLRNGVTFRHHPNAMRSYTVLVVDDDPSIRQLIADALEQEGHTAITAPDGEEAIRLAGQDRPDAVVLDLGLPGVPGDVVAARIRASSERRIPLIVVTASYRMDEAASRVGGAFYLSKPFDVAELLRTVRQACEPPSQPSLGEDPLPSPAT